MPPNIRILIDTPRWLFLGALVAAPWMYGCTPAWAIIDIEMLLSAILALWMAGCAFRGLKSAIHPVLLGCTAIILAAGWWMAFNPHFQDTGDYHFVPIHSRFSFLPGTVDQAATCVAMLRVTCMLGVMCFVCDLASRRIWRRRIWVIMGLTGISVVLFGLVQSAFARPLLPGWVDAAVDGDTIPYFATYYYHGNAGSFINLVLPLVAALAALTLRQPDEHFARALWFPGFFVCVAGAFVNPSRAAMVITAIMCFFLFGWQMMGKSRNELLPQRNLRLPYLIVMIGAIAGLIALSGWQRPVEKWATTHSQMNSANKRLVSTKVCLRMIPDAGWHGFGPGTFGLVFPHYTTAEEGKLIPGVWRYAHDDYLQTVLEWGWFGAIFWGILFFGAVAHLYRQWRKRRDLSTSDRVLAYVTLLAMVGEAAHAVVDFPFQIASLQLYAAVCIGFAWSSGRWEGTLHHNDHLEPSGRTEPSTAISA